MSGQLKEIKQRIGSINEIQQMTKAMKMVAAAKLQRAQKAIKRLRPYDHRLHKVLSHVLQSTEEGHIPYSEDRSPENVTLVLLTSDRGLCGSFNTNLIRQTRHLLKTKYKEQNEAGNVTILSIGKKGGKYFERYNQPINAKYQQLFDDLNFTSAAEVAQYLMNRFDEEKVDRVELIYSKFVNAAKQEFVNEQFLPVVPHNKSEEETTNEKDITPDYIFEPSRSRILERLIPLILKTYLYRALRDNFASEQGARMVAMDNATENADELLEELELSYNQARQAAITKEISEIVAGANALEDE